VSPTPDVDGDYNVDVSECPTPGVGKPCLGRRYVKSYYRSTRFRRVYRPDGSLISKLLEPVDLGVRA
jgi:hypothetical protein